MSMDFTAKFNFLYVTESELEILESLSRIFYLRLRNPGFKHEQYGIFADDSCESASR